MDSFINKLLIYMEPPEGWADIPKMKMQLGLQVLLHNMIMIGSILLFSKLINIFSEATILLFAYGLLKLTAGGVHFSKSLYCLLATGTFVVTGVMIAKYIHLPFSTIVLLYITCVIVLWIIGPQGTTNNPIAPAYYHTLKIRTVVISIGYFVISFFCHKMKLQISNLLLISIIFETISLLPNKLRELSR